MSKPSSYLNLSEDLRSRIEREAVQNGVQPTAKKYMAMAGMKETTLIYNINQALDKGVDTTKPQGKRKALSQDESAFLERMRRGDVSMEELNMFVQTRAFENLLTSPTGGFKFLDFYRMMTLKQESEKKKEEESWAVQLVARSFNGQMPPSTCPKCGHNFMNDIGEDLPSEAGDKLAADSADL
jgi:hypothetical protein